MRAAPRPAGPGADFLRPAGRSPRPGPARLRRGAAGEDWLTTEGVPHKLLHENTYDIVTDKIPEGKTYCSLCSRLRRGILYRAAAELGCNKIALGHHRDDALETLLLNLFFGGKLASMPPRLVSDDGRFVVIRPLAYAAECDLARLRRGPPVPDPALQAVRVAGAGAQRKQMKALLDELERKHPTLRQTMLAALGNVNPSHLYDRRLAAREGLRPSRGPTPDESLAQICSPSIVSGGQSPLPIRSNDS